MARIVCAGHVNWDVTLHVDSLPAPDGEAVIGDQSRAGGGSAANTASVLADLAYDPLLLGSLGDDQHADLVTSTLTDSGVDCEHLKRVPDRQTTVKYLVVDESGDVFVLANDGANEAYTAADLSTEALASANHLHLTSQNPETARRLADRAHAHGLSVSFDPGRRLGERDYGALLSAVDLLFLNEREAATARRSGSLADREQPTVIKRGNGGATFCRGRRSITHEGFDVPVTDTAGAGDAFAAGFLAAYCEDSDDEEALAIANACGALAVQSIGARASLSWDAIETYRS